MSTFDQRNQKVSHQTNVAGDVKQGDHIDFSGATITGSNFNIKSKLNHVTQTVGALPNVGAEDKAKLEDLLKQLSDALQQAPADKAKDAERVSKMTERVVEDAKSEDKDMFAVSAEGLKKAAEALAGVVPTAVKIVKDILGLLSV